MPTRAEIQDRIWKETVLLYRVASAIDKLPDSATRNEFIQKHDRILNELNSLELAVDNTDLTMCYYGFAPKCPGYSCSECPTWLTKRDAGKQEDGE